MNPFADASPDASTAVVAATGSPIQSTAMDDPFAVTSTQLSNNNASGSGPDISVNPFDTLLSTNNDSTSNNPTERSSTNQGTGGTLDRDDDLAYSPNVAPDASLPVNETHLGNIVSSTIELKHNTRDAGSSAAAAGAPPQPRLSDFAISSTVSGYHSSPVALIGQSLDMAADGDKLGNLDKLDQLEIAHAAVGTNKSLDPSTNASARLHNNEDANSNTQVAQHVQIEINELNEQNEQNEQNDENAANVQNSNQNGRESVNTVNLGKIESVRNVGNIATVMDTGSEPSEQRSRIDSGPPEGAMDGREDSRMSESDIVSGMESELRSADIAPIAPIAEEPEDDFAQLDDIAVVSDANSNHLAAGNNANNANGADAVPSQSRTPQPQSHKAMQSQSDADFALALQLQYDAGGDIVDMDDIPASLMVSDVGVAAAAAPAAGAADQFASLNSMSQGSEAASPVAPSSGARHSNQMQSKQSILSNSVNSMNSLHSIRSMHSLQSAQSTRSISKRHSSQRFVRSHGKNHQQRGHYSSRSARNVLGGDADGNHDIAVAIGEGPSSHVKQQPTRNSALGAMIRNDTDLARSLGVAQLANTLAANAGNGPDAEFAVADTEVAPSAEEEAVGGAAAILQGTARGSELLGRVSRGDSILAHENAELGGAGGGRSGRSGSNAGILTNVNWKELQNVEAMEVRENKYDDYGGGGVNLDGAPWHSDNDKIISFLFGTFFLFMAIITMLWCILVTPFNVGMFVIFIYCLLAALYLVFAAMNHSYGCRVATIAFVAPLVIVILLCCFFVGAAGQGVNCMLPQQNKDPRRDRKYGEQSLIYAMDPSKRPNAPKLPKGLKGRGWERSVDEHKDREIRWAGNKGERDVPKKSVLLVGGTGKIGSAIAETLLNFEDNIELHILGRNEMKCYHLVCRLYEECNKLKNNSFEMSGCSADYYICDLSDNVSIETFMILWNKRRRNKLDILINCLGTVPLKMEMSRNNIEMQFDVNVMGMARLIDLLTPNMEMSQLDAGARIINIADDHARAPTIVRSDPNKSKKNKKEIDTGEWTVYTPNKKEYDASDRYAECMACVRMVSNSIAMSFKLQQKYIGVYCCHPGYVNSPVLQALGKAANGAIATECARLPVYLALAEEINVFEHSGTYWSDMKQKRCEFCENEQNKERLWTIVKKIRNARV